MNIKRRTKRLEEKHAAPTDAVEVIVLCLNCPVAKAAGGGSKVEERPFPLSDAPDEPPVRYFFEPEDGGERREITKEEFDALPRARHTLPESHPNHAKRRPSP